MQIKPIKINIGGSRTSTTAEETLRHPYIPTFGIYLKTRKTSYGHCDIGKYKGINIEIYHDNESKSKLYYVSDKVRNWIKSKLIYFEKGIKKIVRSEKSWN